MCCTSVPLPAACLGLSQFFCRLACDPCAPPPAARLPPACPHTCPPHPARLQIFRSRIGSMRKALKSRAEFVFVDAPFLAEGDAAAVAESGGDSSQQGRSWW